MVTSYHISTAFNEDKQTSKYPWQIQQQVNNFYKKLNFWSLSSNSDWKKAMFTSVGLQPLYRCHWLRDMVLWSSSLTGIFWLLQAPSSYRRVLGATTFLTWSCPHFRREQAIHLLDWCPTFRLTSGSEPFFMKYWVSICCLLPSVMGKLSIHLKTSLSEVFWGQIILRPQVWPKVNPRPWDKGKKLHGEKRRYGSHLPPLVGAEEIMN